MGPKFIDSIGNSEVDTVVGGVSLKKSLDEILPEKRIVPGGVNLLAQNKALNNRSSPKGAQ